ncbi:MAG: FecR domain-containing protein [Deltaproteobacteria bacterium]|nr:FecR domain-containing protein [Deltaproteobacteria bacterium]
MTSRYAKLGRAARHELDELVSRSRVSADVQARLFATPHPAARWLWHWVAAASLGLAVAVGVIVWLWPPVPLTFTVAGEGTGLVGAPITSADDTKLLAFSEGTMVWVAPHSTTRVERAQTRGAEVALEGGTLRAQVKHKGDTRWLFHAGPYEVLVTGTKFDLSWDTQTKKLAVAMHEGRVLVQGGLLSVPREVRAGERFMMGGHSQEPLAPPGGATPATEAPAPSSARKFNEEPLSADLAARTTRKGQALAMRTAAAPPELKPEHDKQNVAAALFARADAARLSGNEAQAVALFEEVAERFASDRLAGLASFAAGRLWLVRLGDARAALIDLQRARRLGLGAPLDEDCHARIVEALSALQRMDACKKEQALYLASYPRGPHAGLVSKACR